MEALPTTPGAFITYPQSPIIGKPCHRSLDHIAFLTEMASVLLTGFSPRLQLHPKAHCQHQRNQPCDAISTICHHGQHTSWLPLFGGNDRNPRQQIHQACFIIFVGSPRFYHQRDAVAIGQNMAFTPSFCTIGWIGAGMDPPFTARQELLSATTREGSTSPALPKCPKSFS